MPKVDRSKCESLTLNPADLALTRELVQFAIESLTATLHLAGTRPIARTIERYRDDAVALLERLRAT